MSENHAVPAGFTARIGAGELQALRDKAADDPSAFWLRQAQRLDWVTPPTRAGDWSFDEADFRIKWFEDGTLNLAANCLDRHLDEPARIGRHRGVQIRRRGRRECQADRPVEPEIVRVRHHARRVGRAGPQGGPAID